MEKCMIFNKILPQVQCDLHRPGQESVSVVVEEWT